MRFPRDWLWDQVCWQDLWTVVQWQDAQGEWHDVDGWQGTLDEIVVDVEIVARKTWWVAQSDLGKGPFRWVVTQGKGGEVLVTSEPFDLPAANGTSTIVEIVLTP